MEVAATLPEFSELSLHNFAEKKDAAVRGAPHPPTNNFRKT